MNNITEQIKRMTLGFMLASLPILGGCGNNTITWQEEVKLLDGRVITITQKRRYENNVPREHWMVFKLTEFGNQEITWHENLRPQVLNVYLGKLYVVGTPFTQQEYRQYGKPYPVYVPYQYDAGQWQRIPFTEIPEAIYDTNLLIANAPPNSVKFASFAMKAEEMKDDTLDVPLKKLSATFDISH